MHSQGQGRDEKPEVCPVLHCHVRPVRGICRLFQAKRAQTSHGNARRLPSLRARGDTARVFRPTSRLQNAREGTPQVFRPLGMPSRLLMHAPGIYHVRTSSTTRPAIIASVLRRWLLFIDARDLSRAVKRRQAGAESLRPVRCIGECGSRYFFLAILPKSATLAKTPTKALSSFRFCSRSATSSAITFTSSKKVSIGARNAASAFTAAV